MIRPKVQLKITLFHGPDRVPFELPNSGDIFSNIYQPFHGIISRGLLNKAKQQENISVNLWNSKAHLLERYLQGTNVTDKNLQRLIDWARECKVLSFPQSSQVVCKYLEIYHSEFFQNSKDIEYDLWNVKEGHTSSVWKVSYDMNGNKNSFALNIARDYEAGLELLGTSKTMEKIGLEYPDINMAKVRRIQSIPIDYYGENISVVVVENDWIEGAHEIHLVKDKDLNEKRYVLIERFLTSTENPAQIGKIRGRYFNQDEAVKIEKDIKNFLIRARTNHSVNIKIREGDIVWNGEYAIVVAIS